MSDFTKEDITIFKRVIENYNTIKERIDNIIKHGSTIKDIKDFVENILKYDTTNVDLDNDNKYFDFNCEDMTLSVYEDVCGVYLGDTIEVWDDKTNSYLGYFNTINEIKAIVKHYEEEESVDNE